MPSPASVECRSQRRATTCGCRSTTPWTDCLQRQAVSRRRLDLEGERLLLLRKWGRRRSPHRLRPANFGIKSNKTPVWRERGRRRVFNALKENNTPIFLLTIPEYPSEVNTSTRKKTKKKILERIEQHRQRLGSPPAQKASFYPCPSLTLTKGGEFISKGNKDTTSITIIEYIASCGESTLKKEKTENGFSLC